ncbi:MAG: putative Ig domain-containing protein [Anaeromyxobacteraceae bacterium]
MSSARRVLLPLLVAVSSGCGGGSPAPGAPGGEEVVITTQPADRSVMAGAPATFSVAATGAQAYQWQRSANAGASFTDLAGATADTFTLSPATLADDGARFRVRVTGARGSLASGAAVLTVTAPPALEITSASPLSGAVVGTAYSTTFLATGGTHPLTWSADNVPAGLVLDAGTGELHGTPTQEAFHRLTVRVEDSAQPHATAQRAFDLDIVAPCDKGWGSLVVENAPASTGGRLCPEEAQPPSPANAFDQQHVVWAENHDYGSFQYREAVLVTYDRASGVVYSVDYFLNDKTNLLSVLCSPEVFAPPPCAGVTVDPFVGTATFAGTAVGVMAPPIQLTGTLKFGSAP